MGTSRRAFLARGTALVAGVGAASACDPDEPQPVATPDTADTAPPNESRPSDDASPRAESELIAFRGEHQAGVTAPPAAAGIVAGLDVLVDDRRALAELLRTISDEIEQVMSGDPYEPRPRGFPPGDTGVLGPDPVATGTSVIVGFGASLFDHRFGLAPQRPDELVPMPRFGNDGLVTRERSHGDLSLTVQADTHDAAVHALRQILRRTRGDVSLRWLREGFNTLDPAAGPGEAPARNLMGFKDGTSNPVRGDARRMDRVVWIQPGDAQPGWAIGGTFQAIRVIRMLVEFWDRTRLSEQEAIFGRRRDTGAPVGGDHETDVPVLSSDRSSHIARANPRTPGSDRHLILRRPFNYADGADENRQLDQGLLFTCYQRSLNDGFITVQRRLEGEALEEYIRPLGGGLFVIPPGPGDGYLGESLVDS